MTHKTVINWPSKYRPTVTNIVDMLDDTQRIKLHWKLTLFYDDVDEIISQKRHRLPGMEWIIELGEALLYAIPEEDRQHTTVKLPPEPDPSTHCIECESTHVRFCGSYWDTSQKWIHEFHCDDCDNSYSVVDKKLDRYANFFMPKMYEKYVKPKERTQ